MKLKTTLTGSNGDTETKVVVTTRNTGAILTRHEQRRFHDEAVNRAHEQLRTKYSAREVRFSRSP